MKDNREPLEREGQDIKTEAYQEMGKSRNDKDEAATTPQPHEREKQNIKAEVEPKTSKTLRNDITSEFKDHKKEDINIKVELRDVARKLRCLTSRVERGHGGQAHVVHERPRRVGTDFHNDG